MSNRLISILLLSTGALCAQAQSTYPVVSKAEQQARDEARRPLLDSELAFEREALAKAGKEFDAGPTREREAAVHRHKENIKALLREIETVEEKTTEPKQARMVARAIRPPARIAETKKTANFWDPYNRASDTADFFTSPKEGQP